MSGKGIQPDPDKVAMIRDTAIPNNVKEVRRFLGVASWYRRSVQEFATIVQPLTGLLKTGKHWKWTESTNGLEILKAKLTEAPVLACPDFS